MTGGLRRVAQALGRPFIFVQYLALRSGLQSNVFPRDEGAGVVPGDDPQRVAVIGEATAVGLGVLSHELGMAGHFSRQLSRRTARGVIWCTHPFADLTIHSAASLVRDTGIFSRIDVVLLMVGVGDSIRLTPQRTWRRLLGEALDTLTETLPAGARILVAEVPPLKESEEVPEPWRTISARHGRLLNRATAEVLATRPQVSAVGFPDESVASLGDTDAAQVSRVYAAWARAFLARLLDAAPAAPA